MHDRIQSVSIRDTLFSSFPIFSNFLRHVKINEHVNDHWYWYLLRKYRAIDRDPVTLFRSKRSYVGGSPVKAYPGERIFLRANYEIAVTIFGQLLSSLIEITRLS